MYMPGSQRKLDEYMELLNRSMEDMHVLFRLRENGSSWSDLDQYFDMTHQLGRESPSNCVRECLSSAAEEGKNVMFSGPGVKPSEPQKAQGSEIRRSRKTWSWVCEGWLGSHCDWSSGSSVG